MLCTYLPAGVPDTPELFINDGIATWSPVNSRSPMSDPVSYILTAATDGVEVGRINQTGTSFNNNITQDLSEESLNLQDGETYMICVTVKNMIGYSMPDCVESYTHTGTFLIIHVPTCTCICKS